MNDDNTFEVTWQADDGYAGGARPHRFEINASEVSGMNEDELREYFDGVLREEFEQKVSPATDDEDSFIEWALALEEEEEESEEER